jgi:hypothetical protein
MGYRIAGYSLNGDGGSLLGAAVTEKRISSAKDGDVVISHINQPTHAAGEGVAKAILDAEGEGHPVRAAAGCRRHRRRSGRRNRQPTDRR